MAGFNRLLMMLPAAGQEQHNHKADEDRWRHVRWRPVQAVERSAFLMQSERGNYDVLWDFRNNNTEGGRGRLQRGGHRLQRACALCSESSSGDSAGRRRCRRGCWRRRRRCCRRSRRCITSRYKIAFIFLGTVLCIIDDIQNGKSRANVFACHASSRHAQ